MKQLQVGQYIYFCCTKFALCVFLSMLNNNAKNFYLTEFLSPVYFFFALLFARMLL